MYGVGLNFKLHVKLPRCTGNEATFKPTYNIQTSFQIQTSVNVNPAGPEAEKKLGTEILAQLGSGRAPLGFLSSGSRQRAERSHPPENTTPGALEPLS